MTILDQIALEPDMSTLTFSLALMLLITGFVYVRQILRFTHGLSKLHPGTNDNIYSVTILVPARNEEKHIGACLNSLLHQDYPRHKYRIIVIDDQSEDRTPEIVDQFARQEPSRLKLLSVLDRPENISPKINAFRLGIRESNDDLVFTTDADCVVASGWLAAGVRHFEDGVGVVTGVTLFENNNVTPRQLFGIQFIDFLSHTACAAGAIGNGRVNNCNGSNMAFRRTAYEEVGGYDSLAHLNSGDDSLLAQKIAETGKWKVRFDLDSSSYVTTSPAPSWKDFLNQRMRWAAQTADYRIDTLVFLVSAFVYYATLMSVLIGGIFDVQWLALFIIAILPKLWVDFSILKRFTAMTETEDLMHFYPAAAVIHIPAVLTAVVGGFLGRFDWKGRATRRRTTQ